MKEIIYTILGCLVSIIALAQPSTLSITSNKTSTVVFPSPIRHVDLGDKSVLVQHITEAEHVLLVKAANDNFKETNLSVITRDGSVYSFAVIFQPSPERLVYHVPAQKATEQSYAQSIIDNTRSIFGVKNIQWGLESIVKGIYTNGSSIFFHLELSNHSPIVYGVDFVRFYIRDKTKVKRTARQEQEMTPTQVLGNIIEIGANQKSAFVVAFPRFIIPNGKFLAIEVREKGGGRDLLMTMTNKKILKAQILPDYK